MVVTVAVLLLLVLFLSMLAMDYWQRWKNEKLWSEHLGMLLDETRAELVHERRLRRMVKIKPQ